MVTTMEMQSIPSLIGAGTAVAAAATGLAFGQLPVVEQQNTYPRSPDSTRQKSESDRGLPSFDSLSRAGATSASAASSAPAQPLGQSQIIPPLLEPTPSINATSAQTQPPRRGSYAQMLPARRQSLRKQGDISLPASTVENSRDSMSSSGSWMRRLSIRPLSQHGSLRSSIGPDSPSLFSFGSAAPILSTSKGTSQLPPNKLVKRTAATNVEDAGLSKGRGSRTQMTLRRPATSHQRSATLQHLNPKELPSPPNTSVNYQKRSRANTIGGQQQNVISGVVKEERSRWKSFWHSKLSQAISRTTSTRGVDGSSDQPIGRRVRLEPSLAQVYLVTPNKLMMNGSLHASNGVHRRDPCSRTNIQDSPKSSLRGSENESDPTEIEQRKRPASVQFSPPTNWMARTSSLRRNKRASEIPASDDRRLSAPIADSISIQSGEGIIPNNVNGAEFSQAEADLAAIFRPPGKCRGLPPPPPPLSPLSSFHPDINYLASSSSAPPGRLDSAVVGHTVSSRVNSQGSYARTLERASTVGSSEYQRGFTSGDDDDTDFKTDTPFDSFRTVASGRKQGLDSPLESMFDESPPGAVGSNNKPKRLSIQEILGPSFDGGDKITEEDESASTSVRGPYEELEVPFCAADMRNDSKPVQGLMPQGLPRDQDDCQLTLDDDDDDDLEWAREAEADIYNGLSPPGSMNSRRVNPNLRATVEGPGTNSKHGVPPDSAIGRPRSTIFDWTEPSLHDRRDQNGLTYRPKTVHGKQGIDLRGGRSASRKGPVAAHVRSQSVPLVPDPPETAKSVPKFGTWGLGHKNVSEHWDDDFEFEEDAGSITGPVKDNRDNQFSMLVPASIQATQPTVKAHSGQIRELSLLVNDLKRLCRLGHEMGMLASPSSRLWHEAEGIIALASPDEETGAADDRIADDFDSAFLDERFTAQGFDGASLKAQKSPWSQNASSHHQGVFSPDDIFGTWGTNTEEGVTVDRPRTPENAIVEHRSTSLGRSVGEAMRKSPTVSDIDDGYDNLETNKRSRGKLNFDTNSLKELVKRAGDLRDSLSELVRREDPVTQSPGWTPKHTRADGSPAFTRVFDEPTSSPAGHGAHNQKPAPGSTSISTSPSSRMSRRMQVMTAS